MQTFFSPAISSNIHRYFSNTFHEFKVLKKVNKTETSTSTLIIDYTNLDFFLCFFT